MQNCRTTFVLNILLGVDFLQSFTAACYNNYYDQKIALLEKLTILSHGRSTAQILGENQG